MRAAQQLRGFYEQGPGLDRDQPFPGDRQYTRDTHWIGPGWMPALCRNIRRRDRTRTPSFFGIAPAPFERGDPNALESQGVIGGHIWQTNLTAT
jgi:hypothetical protein